MRVIPLLFALLLAGCSGTPATTTTESTTSTGPAEPAALPVELAACDQFHTFFRSPVEGFPEYVPENFTLRTDDPAGQTTTVPVFGSICPNGDAELWALLQVIPPTALQNNSFDVDAVVLTALIRNATHHETMLSWGFQADRLLHASVRESELVEAGAARVDRMALGDGTLKYSVRTTTQGSPGPFAPAEYRYWITNGTKATGWVQASNANGTELGAGNAIYESEGDPGAPPITSGIGHRVSNVTIRNTWHKL